MRSRQNSLAQWLFLIVGLLLLLVCATSLMVWLAPEGAFSKAVTETIGKLAPSEGVLKVLAWLAGIAGSGVGAALSLLASWHFAEMNLPQRLEDWKKANTRKHLSQRPGFILLARGNGLGPVPASIETSRLMLLRKWLSWGEKERARVLAASSTWLGKEASALSKAAEEAEERQITSHLIRGYQQASQGDDDKAFEEFDSATKIRADNIVSRDIAAGWARKLNKQEREKELLEEMQQAAIRKRSTLDHARALRRSAELWSKINNEPARSEALMRLRDARNLLQPLAADKESQVELGRVNTLFCEVRCDRERVGDLSGPNQPLTRAREYMAGIAMYARPEEPNGEAYGEERAKKVEERVADLLRDPEANEVGREDEAS